MNDTVFLLWAMTEDADGDQWATWDGEFECMVILRLAAVCETAAIADSLADSIQALKVWKTERSLNTLFWHFKMR